jgi:hypothetical protein
LGLELSTDEKGLFRKMLQGDDMDGFDSTAGYVEVPPVSQFVARTLPAGQPVTLDNKHYVTLWVGQWIRDGKALKTVRYLARVGDDNDPARSFFEADKDVRRVQLLPGEAADALGDPTLEAIVPSDGPISTTQSSEKAADPQPKGTLKLPQPPAPVLPPPYRLDQAEGAQQMRELWRGVAATTREATAAGIRPTTGPSARVQILSTPKDHALGRFHWLIAPDRPLALAWRCCMLTTPDGRAVGGGGTALGLPDARPVEVVGERTVKGGSTILHLEVFYPHPNGVPALLDSTVTYGFGGDGGDALGGMGINGNLTRLDGNYVPFAWAESAKGGQPVGTVFCVVRVVAPGEQQSAISDLPPVQSLRVPATTEPAGATPAAKATVTQEAGSTISLYLDKNAVQMRMAGKVMEAAEFDIHPAGVGVYVIDVHDGLVRLRVVGLGGNQEFTALRIEIGADGGIFADGGILPPTENVSDRQDVPPAPASSVAAFPDKLPKNRVALRVLSPGGSPMQIDGIKEIVVWIKEGPWQDGPQPKVLQRFADGWVFVDAQMFWLGDPRARAEITFISGGHTIHAEATLPFDSRKIEFRSMGDPNEINIDETSGPSAGHDEIAGRVVDAHGRPVAAAVFESIEPEIAKKNFPYGVSETTDADGVFRLARVSENPIQHLFYELHAPGYATRWIGDLPVGRGFTVHLYNNTRVRGNLVLPGGAPAAGARLELTTSKEAVRQNYGSFDFTATTVADSAGAYDLLLEPGVYQAVITSPSGATANLANIAVASGAIVALPPQLNPGARLTLRLVDSLSGKPVTGARLTIEKRSPGWAIDDPGTERVSDADGRAHWDNLVPGQTRSESRNIDAVFVDVPTGSAEMKVLMEPAVRITGQVLAPDGSPVAGAVVNVAGLRTGDSRYARSADAQGRFSLQFANLPSPDKKYAIIACDPQARWAHGLSTWFVPAAGLEKTFTIQLTPGGRMHGRVVDRRGNPLHASRWMR